MTDWFRVAADIVGPCQCGGWSYEGGRAWQDDGMCAACERESERRPLQPDERASAFARRVHTLTSEEIEALLAEDELRRQP
jgi:hypothetical protein